MKDYYAYYKTKRGYHPRSLNSNEGWNTTSSLSFVNMPILSYCGEIRSAVKRLKSENKELMIIPGANHTDLYDTDRIPFAHIENFYRKYLK